MGHDVTPHFRVRCRSCGRTVLASVERVADAEAVELRAHLTTCRPDLTHPERGGASGDLGAILAWFTVQAEPKERGVCSGTFVTP